MNGMLHPEWTHASLVQSLTLAMHRLNLQVGGATGHARGAQTFDLLSAAYVGATQVTGGGLRVQYDARCRHTLRRVAAWLSVPAAKVAAFERLQAYRVQANQQSAVKQQTSAWHHGVRAAKIGGTAVLLGATPTIAKSYRPNLLCQKSSNSLQEQSGGIPKYGASPYLSPVLGCRLGLVRSLLLLAAWLLQHLQQALVRPGLVLLLPQVIPHSCLTHLEASRQFP